MSFRIVRRLRCLPVFFAILCSAMVVGADEGDKKEGDKKEEGPAKTEIAQHERWMPRVPTWSGLGPWAAAC